MYDITNELGKRLGLTIDWVEETSFADLVLGLKGNRFDMFCSSIYVIAKRAREIDYSSRIMYESASIYARKDDPRFDSHETMPNINTLRFAVMEGAISYYLLSDHFPGVERHAIQENAPYAQAMMDVVAKKADAVIFPDMDASVYERHNPGQIKVIPAYRHLALFTVAYAMKRDEDAFRRMIDNALTEMHDQQIIRNVLQRYPDILDVVLLEKESGR